MKNEESKCHGCGMVTHGPRDYHPFAACELFKTIRNGDTVEANIRAVVEYGMKAQQQGVSLEVAMRDLTKVL